MLGKAHQLNAPSWHYGFTKNKEEIFRNLVEGQQQSWAQSISQATHTQGGYDRLHPGGDTKFALGILDVIVDRLCAD